PVRGTEPLPGPAVVDVARLWLRGRERGVLLGAVAFQVFVLVAMIALRAAPLLVGRTILLRVEPVDPRDLFRGDYVVLNYEIIRLVPPAAGNWDELRDRTVYVTLEPDPDGEHWHG